MVAVKLSKEIAQKEMFTVTPSTRHPGQKEQWLFHGKVNATCDNYNLQQNNESTAIFIFCFQSNSKVTMGKPEELPLASSQGYLA